MNAPATIASLPDTQSRTDYRGLRIDAVADKAMRFPVTIRTGHRLLPTIATFSMAVDLPAVTKGTHMSRFIELLEEQTGRWTSRDSQFLYFVRKTAPISGVASQTSLCPCSKEISAYGAHNQRSLISIEAELSGEMAIEDLIAIA